MVCIGSEDRTCGRNEARPVDVEIQVHVSDSMRWRWIRQRYWREREVFASCFMVSHELGEYFRV